MGALHELLVDELLDIIKAGIVDEDGVRHPAPAQYFAQAAKLLDASKIEATNDNAKMREMKSLVGDLPFTSTDEYGLPN
jgi:hypothetical protein